MASGGLQAMLEEYARGLDARERSARQIIAEQNIILDGIATDRQRLLSMLPPQGPPASNAPSTAGSPPQAPLASDTPFAAGDLALGTPRAQAAQRQQQSGGLFDIAHRHMPGAKATIPNYAQPSQSPAIGVPQARRSSPIRSTNPPPGYTTSLTDFRIPHRPVRSDASKIHDDFPTVLFLDGRYAEVVCAGCGGNWRVKHGEGGFIRGIPGLRSHYKQVHVAEGSEGPAAFYMEREISDEDVALMLRGQEPVQPLVMKDLQTRRRTHDFGT